MVDFFYQSSDDSNGLVWFGLLVRYSSFKERLSSIMNNIEGQEVEGEQGCEGARVPDYQEYVEDEVK